MVTPADDLLLKHGVTVQGSWSLLGILDAGPDPQLPGSPSPNVQDLVDLMRTLAPAARQLLGRPADHYGVTPLLIFREAG